MRRGLGGLGGPCGLVNLTAHVPVLLPRAFESSHRVKPPLLITGCACLVLYVRTCYMYFLQRSMRLYAVSLRGLLNVNKYPGRHETTTASPITETSTVQPQGRELNKIIEILYISLSITLHY